MKCREAVLAGGGARGLSLYVCSVMVGVPHRPLLPSLPTGKRYSLVGVHGDFARMGLISRLLSDLVELASLPGEVFERPILFVWNRI